jgi:hypothetical protein
MPKGGNMASDDGVIKIGTSVDLSGLRSGMEQAAQVTQASSQSMSEAMAAAQNASQNLADAQKQLGAAAAAGSEQAAQIVESYRAAAEAANANAAAATKAAEAQSLTAKQFSGSYGPLTRIETAYKELATATADAALSQADLRTAIRGVVDGSTPYAAAQASLTAVLRESFDATQALTAAKAELAAATAADVAVTEEDTAAQVNNYQSRRMAMDASYAFTGSTYGAARAIADFASRFPALQAAISAAFDIGIVVAFGDAAYHVGKDIYDALDLSHEAATKLQMEMDGVTNSLNTLIARTTVETDKLNAATAKLEHKPTPNALKDAVDEALLAANELSQKLDGIINKESTLLKSQIYNPGVTGQILMGFGGDHDEQVMLQQHQKWMANATSIQGQLNESRSFGAVVTKKLAEVEKELAQEHRDAAAAAAVGDNYQSVEAARSITALDRQKGALEQLVGYQKREQQAIRDTIALQAAQHRNTVAQAAHQAGTLTLTGTKVANRSALDDAATGALIDKETKQELGGYGRIAALAGPNPSPIFNSLEENALTASSQGEIQNLEHIAQTMAKVAASTSHLTTANKALSDAMDNAAAEQEGLWAAQAEAYAIQQKNAEAMAEATLRAREATHTISPLAAAEQQATLHTRAYAEALKALNAQLAVYQTAGKTVAAAQTQNQILQLQGTHQVQAVQDAAAIHQQVAKPWLDAFQQINQGWLRVQNQMLYTTHNIGMMFAQMGQNLVIWGLDAAEKWALQWIEKELLTLVVHQSTNAAKTTSDTAANAVSLAQHLAKNEMIAQSNAALAFTSALASTANPAYAAGVYALAESFAAMASFDTGTGYVPHDGVAMIHRGEAVIPAPTVAELRGGGGGGGDVHIHQNNNWNGITDQEFKRQLNRHAAAVAGAVQRHLRQTGRG